MKNQGGTAEGWLPSLEIEQDMFLKGTIVKKIPIPQKFNFAEAETRIYHWWAQNGWFKPEVAGPDAKPFVMCMPPPNVTGVLHVGHALTMTIEDLMIRYERMRGKAALWIPGTDHAGIATQMQVEKLLLSQGTSRQQIGREAFLKQTWEWKNKHGGAITEQLRRLGSSCDWDREKFTLDDDLSAAVVDVFVRLYEQGLIYRGPRLVNWSPGLQTAVSDLEVEYREEQGTLYFFNYPLADGLHIPIATTRPETIFGDSAICVHPNDDRYKHLIGKIAYVPIINRPIPVIADDFVDKEFGTGALKITPAHDFNDYKIGQRLNLAMITVMNRDATMNAQAGPYAGLDRFECRAKVWHDLQEMGLAIKTVEHVHVVPHSQRGGEVIEPLISTQWFLKTKPLAEKAIAAVRDGKINIEPKRFEKVYFHWLENIEDWCISRQLWWGHRIPAWYDSNGKIYVGKTPPSGEGWTPEEDVLDTWFSSALWPFSTLGWPEQTADFKRFYPTSVLETGYDILFFWVVRMVMMGLWFTDEVPFRTVYLHGLVRDKNGRKMSKTLGNVLDPLVCIDTFGADSLRFTLATSSTPGNDINLDESKIEANSHFVNKVWQITKFVMHNMPDDVPADLAQLQDLDLPSRWIISRLNYMINNVQNLFDTYQYGEAGRQIYEFMWSDFADWYLEMSKCCLYNSSCQTKLSTQRTLLYVLDNCLRLLHPYMPFVTEELWSHIPHEGTALMLAKWPTASADRQDQKAELEMNVLMALIRGIRNVRAEHNVQANKSISLQIVPGTYQKLIADHAFIITRLCNIAEVALLQEKPDTSEQSASVVVECITAYIPLKGLIDLQVEFERLTKEKVRMQAQIEQLERMLSDKNFYTKAKPDIVSSKQSQLNNLKTQYVLIEQRLAELKQAK